MMDPGQMTERITIQRAALTTDRTGGASVSWSTLATVWAAVRTKGGSEALEDGRMNATTQTAFTIYTRDVTEADRIVWGGETWNVRAIWRSGSMPLTMQIDAERGVST